MYTKYEKYKEADFLCDDYFVKSLLDPTAESEIFWKLLINEKKVDENEFLSAYMTLKSLHRCKPEAPSDRIDAIWDRLNNTNQKKRSYKRFRFVRSLSAACILVVAFSISVVVFVNNRNKMKEHTLADMAKEYILSNKQTDDQIQLISGEKIFAVEGVDAEVEYDRNGQLKVNNQSVSVQKDTDDSDKPEFSQLRVPYGKRAFLKLADGTSLWINSGTTIVYPRVFDKSKREIYVEGEIFADVYHDESRPFIVSTNHVDIRVLGTVFNVTAYKEHPEVDVVLVEGSIRVKSKEGEEVSVKPNQLYTYLNKTSTLKYVDVEHYISWREGKYIFKNESIENILLRLSRYYNVTIILPTTASGITCSGKLELKEDLNMLLNGLSEIASMSYAHKGNEYRIKFD